MNNTYAKTLLALFSTLLILSALPLLSAQASSNVPTVSSSSAILINLDNGDVLYEKETEKIHPAASLTKIMGMLLVSEALQNGSITWEDEVTISEKAWKTGGSRMFLEVGLVYSLADIFKGMAVVSGNDASVAMAEHIAGSTEAFVALMNEKAQELGMVNTHYETVHGLSKEDKTTAKDQAILAAHYLKLFEENLHIHSMSEYTTETRTHPIKQYNQNPLLSSYDGADGLKTGYSNGSYNLVGTAKNKGFRLLVVTLDAKSASARERDGKGLLDYGFEQYKTASSGEKGDVIDTLRVYKSKGVKKVDVLLAEDIRTLIHVDQEASMVVEDELPAHVTGNKKKGDVIGKRTVTVGGESSTYEIVLAEDLPKSGILQYLFDSITMLFWWLISLLPF